MTKIEEIREAIDADDYPNHEFRGYCSELLGRLEIAEKALEEGAEALEGFDRRVYMETADNWDDYEEDESIEKVREALRQIRE